MNAEETLAAMLAFKTAHNTLTNEEILRIFEIAEAQATCTAVVALTNEIKQLRILK